MSGDQSDRMMALLARVGLRARDVERGRIVAWLRRDPGVSRAPECVTAMTPVELADAIERGDHLLESGQK